MAAIEPSAFLGEIEAIGARTLRLAAGKQWNRSSDTCAVIDGAWPLHLATGSERNCVADTRTVIDAVGRHMLAPAAENMGTTVGGITHAFLIDNSDLVMAYFLRWLIPASLVPI